MEKETYIYYLDASDEEIELKDLILTEEIKNNRDIKTITNNILKLSFVKQLQAVHCILCEEYSAETNDYVKFITKLLGQKCFHDHRSIIMELIDDNNEKIKKFENKYIINIVNSEK